MNASLSFATYNYENSVNVLAGALMIVTGIIGLLCNLSIVYIFYKEKSERTEFNLICVFRAFISSLILLFCFQGTFVPITFLGFSLLPKVVDNFIINSSITFYIFNEYLIAITAVNRFVSLFFPFFYQKYFGKLPTFLVLVAFLGYRVYYNIRLCFFQYPPGTCFTFYSADELTWSFPVERECRTNDSDFIVNFTLLLFGSMTGLNVVTFLKIIWFYKSQSSEMEDKETRNRVKKNAWMFFQTILQDSLYLIDLLFTYKLSMISDHRFWSFVSGTFVWECIHLVDGVIMMMFNERLSLLSKRVFSSPPPTNVFYSRTL